MREIKVRLDEEEKEGGKQEKEAQFTYSANADSAQPVRLNTTHCLKRTPTQWDSDGMYIGFSFG